MDFLSLCVLFCFFFFQVRSSDMDLYISFYFSLCFPNFFQDLTNPILLNAIKGETHLTSFTDNSWISYNIVLIKLQPFPLWKSDWGALYKIKSRMKDQVNLVLNLSKVVQKCSVFPRVACQCLGGMNWTTSSNKPGNQLWCSHEIS